MNFNRQPRRSAKAGGSQALNGIYQQVVPAAVRKNHTQDRRLKGLERKVRKLQLIPESKFLDDASTLTVNHNIGSFSLLSIPQGDGQGQREGNEITVNNVQYRFTVTVNATATQNHMRFLVVQMYDEAAEGGAIDILEDFAHPEGLLSPYKKDSVKRYKILDDFTCVVAAGVNPIKNFVLKHYFKKGLEVTYPSASTAVPVRNGIWLFYIGNENTDIPTVRYYSRVTWQE